MAEFASKGVGTAGLTTGIIGSALGAMNSGLLGNVFGGLSNCSDNQGVNRYEAAQQARISELETEVKLRDANFYALSEVGKLRDYMECKYDKLEREISDQRAYNAANTAAMGCMQGQIQQLFGLTKLVVPNTSVCPGWGDVTITPATTTTTST